MERFDCIWSICNTLKQKLRMAASLHSDHKLFSIAPISQRRHGQDKTVLFCPCRRCELNWRQDKTVLSRCPFNLHRRRGQDKTRQDSFVLSVSAVWNRHKINPKLKFFSPRDSSPQSYKVSQKSLENLSRNPDKGQTVEGEDTRSVVHHQSGRLRTIKLPHQTVTIQSEKYMFR